jgi:hypothetical protein
MRKFSIRAPRPTDFEPFVLAPIPPTLAVTLDGNVVGKAALSGSEYVYSVGEPAETLLFLGRAEAVLEYGDSDDPIVLTGISIQPAAAEAEKIIL